MIHRMNIARSLRSAVWSATATAFIRAMRLRWPEEWHGRRRDADEVHAPGAAGSKHPGGPSPQRRARSFPTERGGVMTEFTGLRAVVTGGASGIGRAVAERLAERGANVAVLDLDPSGVHGPLTGFRADVSDDAGVRAAVAEAAERLGGLDILVNNAGIGAVGTVEDHTDDQWHRVLDVNVV